MASASGRFRGVLIALTAAILAVVLGTREQPSTTESAVNLRPQSGANNATPTAGALTQPQSPPGAQHRPKDSTASDTRPGDTRPGVFDLATLGHPPQGEPEREPTTNERFTPDDLAHPERYFESAARVPELNRAEERSDVLRFFESYRDRLKRELSSTLEAERRAEIEAVLARYENAIDRLRQGIAASAATPSANERR